MWGPGTEFGRAINQFKQELNYRKPIQPFISSTFQDFQAEREILVKIVFPHMDSLCRQRGVYCSPLDLRWGINDDEVNSRQIIRLCLEFVNKCSPFFLCLLGDRYGTHRPAERPPLPTTYDQLPADADWLDKNIMAAAASGFDWLLQPSYQNVSITEMEIIQATQVGEADHAFFYFRREDHVDDLFIDLPPEERKEKLKPFLSESKKHKENVDALKNKIAKTGLNIRYFRTPAELARVVITDWTKVIDSLYPPLQSPLGEDADLFREWMAHVGYAEMRRLNYVKPANVNALVRELTDFAEESLVDASTGLCNDDAAIGNSARKMKSSFRKPPTCPLSDRKPVFAVVGERGCGKTSLLANWVKEFAEEHVSEIMVVAHYTGSSARSVSVCEFMQRCIRILRTQYHHRYVPKGEIAMVGFKNLCEAFKAALSLGPCVIVIDGVDKLGSNSTHRVKARQLTWLPSPLPPQCRVILTTATSDLSYRELEMRSDVRIVPMPLLEAIAVRRQVIEEHLMLHGKRLNNEQLDRIIHCKLSELPLFLTVLANELRVFGVYSDLDYHLDWYLAAPSIRDLGVRVIRRWLTDYSWTTDGGPDQHSSDAADDLSGWVADALRLMAVARDGLTKVEVLGVLEMLGYHGNSEVKAFHWALLRSATNEALFEGPDGLLRIAGDYLSDAVDHALLGAVTPDQPAYHGQPETTAQATPGVPCRDKTKKGPDRKSFHEHLAQYFLPMDHCERRTQELPYHLLMAGNLAGLVEVLTEPRLFLDMYGDNPTCVSRLDLINNWTTLQQEGFDPNCYLWDMAERAHFESVDTTRPLSALSHHSGEAADVNGEPNETDLLEVPTITVSMATIPPILHQSETGRSAPRASTNRPASRVSADIPASRTYTAGPKTSTDRPASKASTAGRRTSTAGPRTSTAGPRTSTAGPAPRASADPPRSSTDGPRASSDGPASWDSTDGTASTTSTISGSTEAADDAHVKTTLRRPSIKRTISVNMGQPLVYLEQANLDKSVGFFMAELGEFKHSETLLLRAHSTVNDHFPLSEAEQLFLCQLEECVADMYLFQLVTDRASHWYHQSLYTLTEMCAEDPDKENDNELLEIEGRLLDKLGSMQSRENQYDVALANLQRAEALMQRTESLPGCASIKHHMGILWAQQHKYAAASTAFQEAVGIREHWYGKHHPAVADVLNDLAGLLGNQRNRVNGNCAEAMTLYRRTLSIRENCLGSDHLLVATTLFHLGKLLMQQSNTPDLTEALSRLKRALDIRTTKLGPDHKLTVAVRKVLTRLQKSVQTRVTHKRVDERTENSPYSSLSYRENDLMMAQDRKQRKSSDKGSKGRKKSLDLKEDTLRNQRDASKMPSKSPEPIFGHGNLTKPYTDIKSKASTPVQSALSKIKQSGPAKGLPTNVSACEVIVQQGSSDGVHQEDIKARTKGLGPNSMPTSTEPSTQKLSAVEESVQDRTKIYVNEQQPVIFADEHQSSNHDRSAVPERERRCMDGDNGVHATRKDGKMVSIDLRTCDAAKEEGSDPMPGTSEIATPAVSEYIESYAAEFVGKTPKAPASGKPTAIPFKQSVSSPAYRPTTDSTEAGQRLMARRRLHSAPALSGRVSWLPQRTKSASSWHGTGKLLPRRPASTACHKAQCYVPGTHTLDSHNTSTISGPHSTMKSLLGTPPCPRDVHRTVHHRSAWFYVPGRGSTEHVTRIRWGRTASTVEYPGFKSQRENEMSSSWPPVSHSANLVSYDKHSTWPTKPRSNVSVLIFKGVRIE